MKRIDFTGVPCNGVAGITEVMDWEQAALFLNELCAECPLRYECMEMVNPMNTWSDGIAGGYLFLNGRPMVRELQKMKQHKRPFHDKETLERYIKAHDYKIR